MNINEDSIYIFRDLEDNYDIFYFCLYYLCYLLGHNIPVHKKDMIMFATFCPPRDIMLSEYCYFNPLA